MLSKVESEKKKKEVTEKEEEINTQVQWKMFV